MCCALILSNGAGDQGSSTSFGFADDQCVGSMQDVSLVCTMINSSLAR
jgi:hypothetical protein